MIDRLIELLEGFACRADQPDSRSGVVAGSLDLTRWDDRGGGDTDVELEKLVVELALDRVDSFDAEAISDELKRRLRKRLVDAELLDA